MTQADTETQTLVLERDLRHPPEKIWRAITQPHLIAEWLMQNDFEPQVGRKFNLRWENNGMSGVIDAEVLRLEPGRTLAYSWCSMGADTVVTFSLTPTAGGTHLRMEQSGFRSDRPQNYQGAKWGWSGFLEKLDQLLAREDRGGLQ